MKSVTWFSILGLLVAIPSALPAQEVGEAYNHGSVGIFADYFRFTPGSATTNFVGFGGRAGFHMGHNVQLEGEVITTSSGTTRIPSATASPPRL